MKTEMHRYTNIVGFGKEYTAYQFNGILDWFITINDPRDIWNAQPTYLISELTFLIVGLLTFIHSQRVGGRFRWLWFECILQGLIVEIVAFTIPQINNYWHSQSTVVLLGRRLPLHIIFRYPSFIYTASVCVSRLPFRSLVQAVTTGLVVALIDLPYDIIGAKFVHWTWHDTDPNISDRHYGAPFTSYYFHITFAANFTFMFHLWRKLLCKNIPSNSWISDERISREFLCTILTAMFGMTGGVANFMPLYHPLHDNLGIHTENCVIIVVLIYFLMAWMEDRNPVAGSRPDLKNTKGYAFDEITVGLILHYSVYLGFALLGDPQSEVSIGFHEKVGPCDDWLSLETTFTLLTGKLNKRRKYLCLEDLDEKYYDFKCLPQKPKFYSEWYTICGTSFPNRAECVQVLILISAVAFIFFREMLFKSGPECSTERLATKQSSKINKYK